MLEGLADRAEVGFVVVAGLLGAALHEAKRERCSGANWQHESNGACDDLVVADLRVSIDDEASHSDSNLELLPTERAPRRLELSTTA